jgi:hypothetical protein
VKPSLFFFVVFGFVVEQLPSSMVEERRNGSLSAARFALQSRLQLR